MSAKPRVLFLVTEDWYFVSHRLPLAMALAASGYAVTVATRAGDAAMAVRAAGIDIVDLPFERSLRRPWRDLASLLAVRRLFAGLRPDIVHLVSLKPIIVGASAMLLLRRPPAVLWAITGMGYLVSSDAMLARLLRPLVMRLLGWLFRGPRARVVVQNRDDAALIRQLGIADRAVSVIAGAGVDTTEFSPREPLPWSPPVVLLPARLLRDKGIYEFVAAARAVRQRTPEVRFVLAGARDADQHGAIDARDLESWQREGSIEWWGHCDDMAAACNRATLVCLPSYREGLPKALLEAAACGRPLLSCDVPGCRDICRDGINGRLVPSRDAGALAQAVLDMLAEPETLASMGARSRDIAETEFSLARVVDETAAVYRELLDENVEQPR